ncbi:MAG TPA: protein-disulfide reductase DsbD domain-containing protein [Candidatus Acidoferrales bacterium]|nr:protein-disulfide reductase DsbD domain-containing protein [Candidatus Acidoferrales bacterium]
MMRRLPAAMGIVTGLLCGLVAAKQGNVSSQGRTYVEFEPLQTVTVKPGHSTPVEFTFHVKSGYHINSNRPTTPELIPTQLGFSPPPELVIAKVQYPAGQLTSFPFDPTQKLSVYSGDVIIKAVIIPQSKAAPGDYTVHGEFKYQACDNNACYPPKKLPVEFDVKVASADNGNRSRPKR